MAKETITYRQAVTMLGVLNMLANRDLPDMRAILRVARCVRVLKPLADEYSVALRELQKRHQPDGGTVAEGEKVIFNDPIGLQQEGNNLLNETVEVDLPEQLTEAMMPKVTKTKPDNAEGVAAFIADLGILYDIPEDA